MHSTFTSKFSVQTVIFSGLFILMTVMSNAAPGELDLTFGTGGKVTTDTGNWDYPYAMAIQPDGKILILGNTLTIGDTFAVVRYHSNGTLDTSFDGDGITIIQSLGGIPEAISIQSDGKIVIVGRLLDGSTPGFTVARLNVNGSLDTSFDSDGAVTTRIGAGAAYAFSVGIQLDGKIVVGGSSYNGTDSDLTVVRYNPDGSLDTSFGGDGIVLNSTEGYDDRAYALKIQPDGKLLLAGQKYFFSITSDFELIRYKPDGSLDTDFDGDGIVTTSIGSNGLDDLQAVNIQPDGKIVAGGASILGSSYGFTAVRYNPDGSLDTSFDSDGIVTTQVGNSSVQMYGMSIQQNGKILLAGWTFTGQNDDFAVVRYQPNGLLDTSFGGDGIVTTPVGNGNDKAYGISIQPDGKIVIAGWTHNGTNYDYGVVRYEGDSIAPQRSVFDFDADGKTDLSIFRPSVGEWWYLRSLDGGNYAAKFGASTDKLTPADFTGDGKTDIALFRPQTGEWFILRSEDGSFYSFPFGTNGDIPFAGDFDADGRADNGVFRPSNSTWFIRKSSDGAVIIQSFGQSGDVPVVADYDGDGSSDIAIYRVSLGEWWIQRSSLGIIAFQFGSANDKPVQGDYTGDGKADVALFRPNTGEWFVLRSENQSYYSFAFGTNGDVPSPGDYDGDGKFDAAVFRPSSSVWYVNKSTGGNLIQTFGQSGDLPVPNAFVP